MSKAYRQTPVWEIPNVRAILVQRWTDVFDVAPVLIQHLPTVMSCVRRAHTVTLLKHEALNQCWPDMGPTSQTVCQH